MMYKVIAVLAIVATAHGQSNGASDNSRDDVSNIEPCAMPNGDVGECTLYYNCDSNNTIIKDGSYALDIRAGNGPCLNYMYTCCMLQNQRTQPITPKPVENKPKREGCGWRNPEGVDMKTTGDVNGETKFAEFPWMVAVLKVEPIDKNYPDSKVLVYAGGGSLIHHSIVLTVAHIVHTSKELVVRAGEWDTATNEEIHPYQERDVDKVVIHKDFNPSTAFYDIALLFLKSPLDTAPNVGIACLPPPSKTTQINQGTRCFATGWGKDKFDKTGQNAVILKKVNVPVVSRFECRTKLRSTKLGPIFELHTSFMCAGGERGPDTCTGDGGSPLVCPIEYEDDRYVQSGMVAWGISCGGDAPGVYVDVANVRSWIDEKIKGQGFDDAAIRGYSYTF